jgi:hypothetical protein
MEDSFFCSFRMNNTAKYDKTNTHICNRKVCLEMEARAGDNTETDGSGGATAVSASASTA